MASPTASNCAAHILPQKYPQPLNSRKMAAEYSMSWRARVGDVEANPVNPGKIYGLKKTEVLPLSVAVAKILNDPSIKQQLSSELLEAAEDCVEWAKEFKQEEPDDPLTYDQLGAVRLYTIEFEDDANGRNKSLYAVINRYMAEPKRPRLKPFYSYLKLFLDALVQLPRITCKLYRGVSKELDFYQDKVDFAWWPFSSFSVLPEVAQSFCGVKGTFFTVQCSNAVSIKKYSQSQAEEELLLLPGTRYRVVDRAPALDEKITRILVEETKASFAWTWAPEAAPSTAVTFDSSLSSAGT